MPIYANDGSLNVTIVAGSGGSGSTGSVTAPGTNGTQAQAVQGINNGVPIATTSAPQTGTNERDLSETRTLNAASTSSIQTYTLNGHSTFSFTVTGLTASGATISFFQSNDWDGTNGTFTSVSEVNTGTGVPSLTRNVDGQSAIGVEGSKAVRIQVTTAGTGTITFASNASVRSRYQALRAPLPPGSNTIGVVLPTSAASGKIIETVVAVSANTSTQLVAARAGRIAIEIQPDGTADVGVSRIGTALTSVASSPLIIPSGAKPLYNMPVATLTAITAYTATAQNVRVIEYII